MNSVAHEGWVGQQIYPSWSHKVEHFQKIQNNTGIPVKNMLFFDDEDRNIQAVSLFTLLLMFASHLSSSPIRSESNQFSLFCSCVLFCIVGKERRKTFSLTCIMEVMVSCQQFLHR